MSSSEPRLSRPSSAGSLREPTGGVSPLKSTVPFTTHILLVGVMLLFFVGAILITLQATWQWWLLPAAIAIPVVVVLTERARRVQKAREARRAGAGLDAGQDTTGRAGSVR